MTQYWNSPLTPEAPYSVKRRTWVVSLVFSFIVMLLVFAAGGNGDGISGDAEDSGPVTRTIVQLGDPEAPPEAEPEPVPPPPSEPEPEPEPTKLAERAENAPEPTAEPEPEPQEVEVTFSEEVFGAEDGELTDEETTQSDASASGQPGDSASGAAAALPLPYVELSTRKYLERVRYPARAEKRNIEGVGLLQVTVRRDGTVVSWEIIESSGSPILDQEIRRVARQVRKLDPLPPDYPADEATFIVPFNFILQ